MLAGTVLMAGLCLAGSAAAAPAEKRHYLGEVKLSGPDGRPFGSQVMLLEKTHDPDKAQVVERAILIKPDGTAEDRTVRLAVAVKDGTFTVVDEAKTVEGGGTLAGPAWHWTYMKGTFTARGGVKVEDENFLSDPTVLTARKTVTGKDGKVIVRMDMTLKAVSPATFDILAASALKK